MKKLKFLKSFKEKYTDFLRENVLEIEGSYGHCSGGTGGGPVGHCTGYKEPDVDENENDEIEKVK